MLDQQGHERRRRVGRCREFDFVELRQMGSDDFDRGRAVSKLRPDVRTACVEAEVSTVTGVDDDGFSVHSFAQDTRRVGLVRCGFVEDSVVHRAYFDRRPHLLERRSAPEEFVFNEVYVCGDHAILVELRCLEPAQFTEVASARVVLKRKVSKRSSELVDCR